MNNQNSGNHPAPPTETEYIEVLERILEPQDEEGHPVRLVLDITCARTEKRLIKEGCIVRLLDPEEARLHLLELIDSPRLKCCDSRAKIVLLEYLLSSEEPNIFSLVDLPIVPLRNGNFVSLCEPNPSDPAYILGSSEAAIVFHKHGSSLIDLSQLSRSSVDLFLQKAPEVLNVEILSPKHVRAFLDLFPDPVDTQSKLEDVARGQKLASWLASFWVWLDGWDRASNLLEMIPNKHLFPLANGFFRRVSSEVFLGHGLDRDTQTALCDIGIPLLDSQVELREEGFLLQNRTVFLPNDIKRILRSISFDAHPPCRAEFRESLAAHFVQHLPSTELNDQEIERLHHLPIFPLLRPADKEPMTTRREFGRLASFTPLWLDGIPVAQLPSIPDHTFVDVSDAVGRTLALTIIGGVEISTLSRVDLARYALNHWRDQHYVWRDALAEEIILNLSGFSPVDIELVRNTKILPVGEETGRKTPWVAIDPASPVGTLLPIGHRLLPRAPFTIESELLQPLRDHGLFNLRPQPEILLELINICAGAPSGEESMQRAERLLGVIDEYFRDSDPEALPLILPTDLAWVPGKLGEERKLYLPSECRDDEELSPVYNHILASVSTTTPISSPALRTQLGWTNEIPLSVICSQIDAVLRSRNQAPLAKIIYYLGDSFAAGKLLEADLDALRDVLAEKEWIPVHEDLLVSTDRAVLEMVDAKLPFKAIPSQLLERSAAFFASMGCYPRPSPAAILSELANLPNGGDSIEEARLLLEELCTHHDIRDLPSAQLLVPDHEGHFRPSRQLYHTDSPARFENVPPLHFLVHPDISQLCAVLGIRHLEEAMLQHHDPYDFQAVEDISSIIYIAEGEQSSKPTLDNVLLFFAEKRASSFSILLDEKEREGKNRLVEKLASASSPAAIVIHSDVSLSDDDITCLRSSKQSPFLRDLYRISKVITLLSGNGMLFLDPTSSYLPNPRTSCWIALDVVQRSYKSELSTMSDLFGFDPKKVSYDGTMIYIPVREQSETDAISEWLRRAARRSMIFSSFTEIKLAQRSISVQPEPLAKTKGSNPHSQHQESKARKTSYAMNELARVLAERTTIAEESAPEGLFVSERVHLPLIFNGGSELQTWLVTHLVPVPAPPQFGPSPNVQVDLALQIHPPQQTQQRPVSRLFSTLPLDGEFPMPFHLNAPLRREEATGVIPFDQLATPSDGLSTPGSFNGWILSALVPRLYLFTIEQYISKSPLNATVLWPAHTPEESTSIFTRCLYDMMPSSNRAILQSTNGGPISPQNAVVSWAEPAGVRSLLPKLRVDGLMSLEPSHVLQSCLRHRTVASSPSLLREMLRRDTSTRQLRTEFDSGNISIAELDSTLLFLLENATPIQDLPLLVTQDGRLRHISWSPLFDGSEVSRHIFTPEIFISAKYNSSTLNKLKDLDLVQDLDLHDMVNAITDRINEGDRTELTQDEGHWVSALWSALDELGLPASMLSHLPLLSTVGGLEYISENYCRRNPVLLWNQEGDRPLNLLVGCGVVCVRLPPPVASGFPSDNDMLESVLACFRASGVEWEKSFSRLSIDEHRELGRWLRDLAIAFTKEDTLLLQLPIWEVEDASGEQLRPVPASHIFMLPRAIAFIHIIHFVSPRDAFAEYSDDLSIRLRDAGRPEPTIKHVFDKLIIPDVLHADLLEAYTHLLELMLDAGFESFLLPNRNCVMVKPSLLFHPTHDLFKRVFIHTEGHHFPHSSLDYLLGRLRRYIHWHVSFPAFRRCAEVVSSEVTGTGVLHGPQALYAYLCDELAISDEEFPSLWRDLDDVAFIPPLSGLVGDLPPGTNVLVTPRRALLPEHLSFAGPQMVAVPQPSARFIEAMPAFGVPTVQHVVAHLERLAGASPVGDRLIEPSLVDGLLKTYAWLDRHSKEAKDALLERKGRKLLLNVDDPLLDDCRWVTADDVVLNLFFGHNCAKQFLSQFPNFLKAAGVQCIIMPQFCTSVPNGIGVGLEEWEELRQRREEFDLWLLPKDSQNAVGVHRAHFRVNVKFFKEVLSKSAAGSTSTAPLQVDVNTFTLEAVLDFIYTGSLSCQPPSTTPEAQKLLKQLLEVLSVSEWWNLTRLKLELGRLIVGPMKLLIPETFKLIQEKAREYKAGELHQACADYACQNAEILKRLVR